MPVNRYARHGCAWKYRSSDATQRGPGEERVFLQARAAEKQVVAAAGAAVVALRR